MNLKYRYKQSMKNLNNSKIFNRKTKNKEKNKTKK